MSTLPLETRAAGTDASSRKYHAFISLNSRDRADVRLLLAHFERFGLRVYVDEDDLIPGDEAHTRIHAALAESSACVLCIGPHGPGLWQKQEAQAAVSRAVRDPGYRVIPVLLPGSDQHHLDTFPFLNHRVYVDMRLSYESELDRLITALLGGSLSLHERPRIKTDAPYRGLSAFGPADSSLFFGRDEVAEELTRYLRTHNFLAIVGGSGSGKSSLAMAGVLPRLARTRPDEVDSDKWLYALLRPGEDPLDRLGVALAKCVPPERVYEAGYVAGSIRNAERGERSLIEAVRSLLGHPARPEKLVVVIDQFEELFTLADAGRRKVFLDNLIRAVSDPEGRIVALITLRADFYGNCAEHVELGKLLERNNRLLGRMEDDQLRDAILRPALIADGIPDPALIARLVASFGRDPGRLPLLQHMLQQLWQRALGRVERRMTLADYDALGGLDGALNDYAESVYVLLDAAQQEACPQLFTQLVEAGQGSEDTRRRVKRSHLPQRHAVLLDTLVRARLLVLDDEDVELSHEKLISGWKRLRKWVDDARDAIVARRRLEDATRHWAHQGNHEEWLYDGAQLTLACEYVDRHGDALAPEIKAFVAASRARAQQRDDRRRRVKAGLTAVGCACFVAILWLGLSNRDLAEQAFQFAAEAMSAKEHAAANEKRAELKAREAEGARNDALESRDEALLARHGAEDGRASAERNKDEALREKSRARRALKEAETQRDRAEQIGRSNRIRALVAGSEKAWFGGWPQLSLLLAVESAMQVRATSTPESWQAFAHLAAFLIDRPLGMPLLAMSHQTAGSGDPVHNVVCAEDCRTVALEGYSTVTLWDRATAAATRVAFPETIDQLAFSSDGTTLIVRSGNILYSHGGNARGIQQRLGDLVADVASLAVAESGAYVLTGASDGVARLWRTDPFVETMRFDAREGTLTAVALSRRGDLVATGSTHASAKVWSAGDGALLHAFKSNSDTVNTLAFSPRGDLLASGSLDNTVRVWELESERVLSVLRGHQMLVRAISIAADSTKIATGSDDRTARVWPLDGGAPQVFRGHEDEVTMVRLVEDGRELVTASRDDLRVWRLDGATPFAEQIAWKAYQPRAALSRDGTTVVLGGQGVAVRRGPAGELVKLSEFVAVEHIAVSGAGDRLLLSQALNGVRVVDISDPKAPRILAEFPQFEADAVALSADGATAVAGLTNGQVLVWRVDDLGRSPVVLPAFTDKLLIGVAVSADGSRIAAAAQDGSVRVWRALRWDRPTSIKGSGETVDSFAMSADGKILAVGGHDGKARIRDASGHELAVLRGHTARIRAIALSADGSRVITGSDDKTVRLWKLGDSSLPLIVDAQVETLASVAISADGDRIAAAGSDKTKIWNLSLPTLLAVACRMVGRNMTDEEWRAYFPGEAYRTTCPA